jgi:hypothetical protein
MRRKAWLICGIVSSLLYVAMNVVTPMQWKDYRPVSQTVSELSAVGAPTRPLWLLFGLVYTALVLAFGAGIWMSARRNRSLQVAGGLMVAYGALGFAWPFAPMHPRGTEFTLIDTMHITLAMVTVLLMLFAIGFGAAAFGKRFRFYSIVTIVILLGFGALTTMDAPKIAVDQPTPWVGVWERINIGAFLLWVVVLAGMLWRTPFEPSRSIEEGKHEPTV